MWSEAYPGGPAPTPLFLDQTESRRAEKKILKIAPPLESSKYP